MSAATLFRGCEKTSAKVFGVDRDSRLKLFSRRSGRRYSCFEVVGEVSPQADCSTEEADSGPSAVERIDPEDLAKQDAASDQSGKFPTADLPAPGLVERVPADANSPSSVVSSSGRSGRKTSSGSRSVENSGGTSVLVRRRG